MNTRYFKIKREGEFFSPLEKFCFYLLEENNINFKFQSSTFTLLEGFKYELPSIEKGKTAQKSIRPITYTPDFIGDNWIIETKGFRTESFNLKWKLLKAFLKTSGKEMFLYMPTNKQQVKDAIESILVNSKFISSELNDT